MKLRSKSNSILLLSLFIIGLSGGCDLINKGDNNDEAERIPVARVKNTYLYSDDLRGIATNSSTADDSTALIEKYINNWIKKQLLIDKAISQIEYNEAELERKLLDYRYALITHEYEKYYVNQEINKEVSDEEITSYYEEKRDNFLLKQNIIRCLFAKIPKEAPRINELSRSMRSYPNSDLDDIKSYCFQFATKSSLEDSLWINFDEIIQNTVLFDIPNKVQFLKSNKFVESSDDDFIYLLKILDYKISDQISPLEFIREDITNIIINKRKIAIKNKLEDDIYKQAKENEEFEVF